MKIGVTSDLHGYLPEVEECDLLLICGDIMPLSIQFQDKESMEWIQGPFKEWCLNCGAKHVIFTAGNHDFSLYWHRKELKCNFLDEEISYLNGTILHINGLTIYGTPWCHEFGNWAFMRDNEKLAEKYSNMPNNIDILISHDAPRIANFGSILDTSISEEPIKCGNTVLATYIIDRKPKYAFCGHIHSGDHTLASIGYTTLANVSYVDEYYNPTNKILYFNYGE